jgi:hypothetical protein
MVEMGEGRILTASLISLRELKVALVQCADHRILKYQAVVAIERDDGVAPDLAALGYQISETREKRRDIDDIAGA